MNYNYIYFYLLKLGPIEVACQDIQCELKISARAKCVLFEAVFIVDLTAKFFEIVCTSGEFNTFYYSRGAKLELKYP